MSRIRWVVIGAVSLAGVGCGVGEGGASRTLASRQALTGASEMVELEAPSARLAMFRQVAVWSQLESGRAATPEALFPIVQNGVVVSAPGVDVRADLLQAPDSGHPLDLSFDGPGERWPEDRRDSLQGLSEREAGELVARSLLNQWGLRPNGTVQVDRATGAPYAAAYVNGILRINPSFLYLAAAASAASTAPANE
jgi:hypothetical protein